MDNLDIAAARTFLAADRMFASANCGQGSRAAWAALKATAALDTVPASGRLSVTVSRPGEVEQVITCVPG